MGSEWPLSTLGGIASKVKNGLVDGPFGSNLPASSYTKDGVPVIRGSNLTLGLGRFVDSAFVFVSEDTANRLSRSLCGPNDIVFTKKGTIGQTGIIPEGKFEKYLISSNQMKLTVDSTIADPLFVYYYVSSKASVDKILRDSEATGVPKINLQYIKNFPIRLPSLGVQKSVATILGSFDDKIALNHQINTTLESMAQALFKSWFVDFDPVIDNALAAGNPIPDELKARADARAALGNQRKPLPDHIRQQFPDRFVLTEDMEWVPQGWALGMFSDVALHVRMNAKTEEIAPDDSYVGLEHIGRKQFFLSEYGYGSDVESNKSRFQCGDLLFGKLRPYFHKVCRAPFGGVCSTDILVFRARERRNSSFMYMTAYREDFVEYANACSTGTRMPRANAKDLLKFPVALPSEEIQTAFENLTATIWEKGSANVSESTYLAKLRNTLLPKLLSGELRVPEAERKLEVAL